jgi:AraC-like DNA-binding protein
MLDLPPVMLMQVSDPVALASAVRNASLTPCQLSAHPAPSLMARVACENVCLDFVALGPAMLFHGAMPEDCYTLVFVIECQRRGRSFNFSTDHNDGYMGFFPPGGNLDAYTPEGYSNASLTVPSSVFLATLQRLFPEIPEKILSQGGGMRIGPAEQSTLRKLLSSVMEGIQNPSQPLNGKMERKMLEPALLDAFIMALRSGCDALVPHPGIRIERRLKRLRQARDYLADRLHEPVRLTSLCKELNLSRRGVELLFQDSMGIGPTAYIRHQRLHGVRRSLQAGPAAAGVVKKSALHWGFWHMGHFSREYRTLFGESPSQTVNRHR